MDNNEANLIQARLDTITAKVDRNCEAVSALKEAIGNLKTQTQFGPLLIKWVVFPLVTILGSAYGITTIVGR